MDADGPQERDERIWAAVAAIPVGRVMSYGEVARRAGLPGRARMVARALRRAPADMALPWHRVVNARHAISIPDPELAALQRRRLEAEGVAFAGGRVAEDHRLRETDSLDALLWRPPD